MKFKAVITYSVRTENGLIQQRNKHVNGSRTAIFNAMSDILIETNYSDTEELVDLTVIIRRGK